MKSNRLPSGNFLQFAIENGPVEVVSFSIETCGSFNSSVSLQAATAGTMISTGKDRDTKHHISEFSHQKMVYLSVFMYSKRLPENDPKNPIQPPSNQH